MDYIAYLQKDRNSDFGVSFPDFPGCITAGRTLEEAREMAGEALAFHIAGMIEDGEAVPEPSSLDTLVTDPLLKEAVAFLVHVEPQTSRTVRINITVREHQVEKIDHLATSAGMTRSAYMVQSALNNKSRSRSSEEHTVKRARQRIHSIAAQADRSYGKKHSRSVPPGNSSKRTKRS